MHEAVTAQVILLNDVARRDFEQTQEIFASAQLPNIGGFTDDGCNVMGLAVMFEVRANAKDRSRTG